MFIRSHAGFKIEADKAKAILRQAKVVASDETGVRIEGTNSYHWVFHCKDAVVHQPPVERLAPHCTRRRIGPPASYRNRMPDKRPEPDRSAESPPPQ